MSDSKSDQGCVGLAPTLGGIGCILIVTSLLLGTIRLWSSDGIVLSSAFRFAGVLGILLCACGWAIARSRTPPLAPFTLTLLLGVLFLSDWMTRPYSFLPAPTIRGEITFFFLVSILFSQTAPRLLNWIAPLCAILFACTLLGTLDGGLVFSDDHASFLYRLMLLKEQFPRIPFYFPLWNSGIDAREFFITGSIGMYLLYYPLILISYLPKIYSLLIVCTLFGVLPISVWGAARLLRLATPAPAIAVILALCNGLIWYRWALKYGTMGFVTSATLAPLGIALLWSLGEDGRKAHHLFLGAGAVLTLSLMLLWPASGMFLLPTIAIFFVHAARELIQTRSFSRATVRTFFCGIALFFLNAPWMAILLRVSPILDLANANLGAQHSAPLSSPQTNAQRDPQISTPTSQLAGANNRSTADVTSAQPPRRFKNAHRAITVAQTTRALREFAMSTNPLIWLFALPGVLAAPRRLRLLLGATLGAMFFAGTVLPPWKPQLEFDRMLVAGAILACLPAADYLAKLVNDSAHTSNTFTHAIASATPLAFLFAGVFSTASILKNRSAEHFNTMENVVPEMAQAIERYSGSGRTVFVGFVLHELSGGHIAPLPLMTNRPMVACSPFHDQWRYRNVIPREYTERDDAGIEEYLTLMNSTAVVAHEPVWKRYFLARPELYEEKWRGDSFILFSRKTYQSNYVLEGSADLVAQDHRSLTLIPHSSEVTIKFAYFPFLQSSSCKISGKNLAGGITHIRLSQCQPNTLVTISAQSGWERLIGGSR